MMNYIWAGMILFSCICALLTRWLPELSDAVSSDVAGAVQLVIVLLGMMCVWTGLMKTTDTGGLTKLLSRTFYLVMGLLSPKYPKDSVAMKVICTDMTTNLLGLGNAATLLGIAATKETNRVNKRPTEADNNMMMFVVISMALIQPVLTFMGTLRVQYGSAQPSDIASAVQLVSIVSLGLGILAVKLLERQESRLG